MLVILVAVILGQPAPVPPGSEVEIIGRVLFADEDGLKEYKAAGKMPASNGGGRRSFGLMVGDRAKVMSTRGDHVQVTMTKGNWQGRRGWLARDDIRIMPTAAENAKDAVDGLSLDRRRQIFKEFHQVGAKASKDAEAKYPSAQLTPQMLKERRAFYEGRKKSGRLAVLKKYKLKDATLEKIDEGMEKKWPLGD